MSEAAPPAVVPNIYVDSVETLREFYMDKLDFGHRMGIVGKDGKLDFCIVQREGAMVMMARPQERIEGTAPKYPTKRPLEVYIPIKGVDGYYAQVKARSAPVTQEITTQWWGDRNFAVQDPYGYTLWFYETVGQMAPPPGVKLV